MYIFSEHGNFRKNLIVLLHNFATNQVIDMESLMHAHPKIVFEKQCNII